MVDAVRSVSDPRQAAAIRQPVNRICEQIRDIATGMGQTEPARIAGSSGRAERRDAHDPLHRKTRQQQYYQTARARTETGRKLSCFTSRIFARDRSRSDWMRPVAADIEETAKLRA